MIAILEIYIVVCILLIPDKYTWHGKYAFAPPNADKGIPKAAATTGAIYIDARLSRIAPQWYYLFHQLTKYRWVWLKHQILNSNTNEYNWATAATAPFAVSIVSRSRLLLNCTCTAGPVCTYTSINSVTGFTVGLSTIKNCGIQHLQLQHYSYSRHLPSLIFNYSRRYWLLCDFICNFGFFKKLWLLSVSQVLSLPKTTHHFIWISVLLQSVSSPSRQTSNIIKLAVWMENNLLPNYFYRCTRFLWFFVLFKVAAF